MHPWLRASALQCPPSFLNGIKMATPARAPAAPSVAKDALPPAASVPPPAREPTLIISRRVSDGSASEGPFPPPPPIRGFKRVFASADSDPMSPQSGSSGVSSGLGNVGAEGFLTTMGSLCTNGATGTPNLLNTWIKTQTSTTLPGGQSVPKGSTSLTGSPPANPYAFVPPASPNGSSCVNCPVAGS